MADQLLTQARVIRNFLRTALQRGLQVERYVRKQGEPQLINPRYAIQDEAWKARAASQ